MAKAAAVATNEHGWCGDVDEILLELGITPVSLSHTIGVKILISMVASSEEYELSDSEAVEQIFHELISDNLAETMADRNIGYDSLGIDVKVEYGEEGVR